MTTHSRLRRPVRRTSALILVFCLLGGLHGCSIFTGETVVSTVRFSNESASPEAIHILGPGESFGPANRLASGQHRSFSYEALRDSPVQFRAGRSGQVLGTISCFWPVGSVSWVDVAGEPSQLQGLAGRCS